MIDQIYEWFSPSVTQHVALALTHSLWQGMIVAFAVDLILRLLRDKTPEGEADEYEKSVPAHTRANLRYTIACFGLLVLAALPMVNLAAMETVTHLVAQETPESGATVTQVPLNAAGATVAESAPAEEVVSLELGPAIAGSLQGETVVTGSAEPTASASSWVGHLALQVFFWTWFAGVALLSIWHLAGWVLSQRMRRGTMPGREVMALVEQAALRLGVWRSIDVRGSKKATVPMVIGWIKPVLILPAKVLAALEPRELEAVVAHELAHVRRNDYLVNLIQTVIETVMFYHPGVWWMSGRIRWEREFCADDMAMRVFGRELYARSLVAVAETSVVPVAHAVAANGGSLLHRVQRILRYGDPTTSLPWSAKCSALAGMVAAVCLSAALIAVAEGPTNPRLNADEGEQHAMQGEFLAQRNVDEDAGPATGTREIPDEEKFRIERAPKSREWRSMISRARNLPAIRSGNGRMTLMRIVLENGRAGAPIQLESTKLVDPNDGSGGGRYLQIQNGNFVLIEHINSASRKDGKDPVEIGSFTHYRSTIWVDVPEPGKLAVLGDVILSPVPGEQMGRIIATAATAPRSRVQMNRMQIGPIAAGGPYGETLPFRPAMPTDTGKIAPGSYKVLLPDFDMQKSRWTVEVKPGEVTRLQFVANSQREIEKVSEKYRPLVQKPRIPKLESSAALNVASPYADVLRFLAIPPSRLPKGCMPSEIRTAPVVPVGIVLDRKQIALVAAHFGIRSSEQLDEVQAAVTRVYEEDGERNGMEIGIFALCFSDDAVAERLVKQLSDGSRDHSPDRTYLSNGRLALCVWRDKGVSDASYNWFCDYFRKTRFDSREPAEVDKPGTEREQIGQVLGRPVYRDEIRENFDRFHELHRIFGQPVMRHYIATHREETELNEEEIQAALRYHAREAEVKGGRIAEAWQDTIDREREENPKMLARLQEKLANPDLPEEEREELEKQRPLLEAAAVEPGRFFVNFYYSRYKFHQYLYRNYGGGRIMFQQLGPEAFDAHHRWLREREEQGDFQITDATLRDEFYEYWTKKDVSWKGSRAESLGDTFRWPWESETTSDLAGNRDEGVETP